jgi:hypothetical protein
MGIHMGFDDLKAELKNEETLTEDNTTDQWCEGDVCGEGGCEETVAELSHERDAQIDAPRHPEAPETEFVCIHHGVVASR